MNGKPSGCVVRQPKMSHADRCQARIRWVWQYPAPHVVPRSVERTQRGPALRPVPVCRRETVPSYEPEATRWPSEDQTQADTRLSDPMNMLKPSPVSLSQMRTKSPNRTE